ncbi:hypothetical protein GVAV_000018 [Gurleya vavrai]
MATMFFLIAYIYSILRDTKDAVVMERQEPASIGFLKSTFVTPFSIFVVIMLQKWLMVSSVSKILKKMTLIFGCYFIVYGTLILTFQELLEPNKFMSVDAFGDGKMAMRGLQGVYAFILTINFWTSSLLYVTSELWGNIVLSLLFMTYANEICRFKQAMRFIPMFIIGSNIGLFLSGLSMLMFCYLQDNAQYLINRFVINSIFIICGTFCIFIYFIHQNLEENIIKNAVYTYEGDNKKKEKPKMSFSEGFKFMMKSKLLLQICFIVLAYNISTNLIDAICKSAIKEHAKVKNLAVGSHVMRTQAINQIITALCVIFILCSPMSRCIQILSWTFVGFITPFWAASCTVLVLFLSIYNTGAFKTNQLGVFNAMFGDMNHYLTAEKLCGQAATSGLKIFKYAFFDIAKEAISMRICQSDRAFYKSIYDGICGKLGKGGGSIIQNGVILMSNAVDPRCGAQYYVVIIAVMVVLWLNAVRYLGNKYNDSVNNNCDIDVDIIGKKPQYES